jgi:hypothetical protein
MNLNSIFIAIVAFLFTACQSSQKSLRQPAETTVLEDPFRQQDSQTETTDSIVLQDLTFTPQMTIPKGSLLKINEAEKNNAKCFLKLNGPRNETVGYIDEEAPYRIVVVTNPTYVNPNGTPVNMRTGFNGMPIVLPLNNEFSYQQSDTFSNYNDLMAGRNGWFYKDGAMYTFHFQRAETFSASGGKILIGKTSIEVDPYFKHVTSITHEVRLGYAHQKDTEFSKLPLQAKMTCANANVASFF